MQKFVSILVFLDFNGRGHRLRGDFEGTVSILVFLDFNRFAGVFAEVVKTSFNPCFLGF